MAETQPQAGAPGSGATSQEVVAVPSPETPIFPALGPAPPQGTGAPSLNNAARQNAYLPVILVARVQEGRHSSTSSAELVDNIIGLVGTSVVCTVALFVLLVVPISMLTIGILYVNDCRAETNIPVYLIVGGIVMLIDLMVDIYNSFKWRKDGYSRQPVSDFIHGVIGFFTMGWFIAGCVWTYRAYVPDFENTASSNYCNKTLYYFTFTLITAKLVVLVVFFTCVCCLTCIALTSRDVRNPPE